jgi:predicted ArsR family transcriptional regulator
VATPSSRRCSPPAGARPGHACGRRSRPRCRPLEDRLRELARLQDELGYLAEARTDGGELRLIEHNCAVLDVAQASPVACQAELELFEELLGAEVRRERHIASGDRCCEYRVGPTA